jgi:hypothetical protein
MIAQSVDLARLMARDMPPMQRSAHLEARHSPRKGGHSRHEPARTALANPGAPAKAGSPAVRRPSEELD